MCHLRYMDPGLSRSSNLHSIAESRLHHRTGRYMWCHSNLSRCTGCSRCRAAAGNNDRLHTRYLCRCRLCRPVRGHMLEHSPEDNTRLQHTLDQPRIVRPHTIDRRIDRRDRVRMDHMPDPCNPEGNIACQLHIPHHQGSRCECSPLIHTGHLHRLHLLHTW